MTILNKDKYMVFRADSIIHGFILILLVLTPIFSIYEALALIFGGLVNNSTALTPVYIKAIKDLGFILIIFVSFLFIVRNKKVNTILLYIIFIFCIFILMPAFYFHENIIIFFSGIRWLMPFVLAVFLVGYITENLLNKIGEVLFYLFILHFIMQIIQLFFADAWFGLNSLGLSARNPGLFFIPSTAAFFSILVLFFSKFYMKKSLERKIWFLIPISIFLTASGTGIGVYIVFITLFYLKKDYFPLVPFVLLMLAIILVFLLDTLSGRAGLVEDSFGARLIMFSDVFHDGVYLAENFGYGTSTGYLIANKYGLDFDMIPTDSWYATVIVNLGIVNSFLLLLILFVFFTVLTIFKQKEKLIFLLVYSLFSATTVFTESYPANLLFAVLLAYYLKKEKNNETSHNS